MAAGPLYIAGHRGLVGSAIWREAERRGLDLAGRTRAELDLTVTPAVSAYVADTRPSAIIIAAAYVGGILANATYPADFLSINLQVQLNLLDASVKHEVPKVLFLGSSCIYPKLAAQPIREESLLTGPLEPTNDAYAIAKIAGVLHVQAIRRQYALPYISAMPTNLFGPGGQLRSREGPRHAGDDSQDARGQGSGRVDRPDVGDRRAAPGVPARRRPGQGGAVPARGLR